MTSSAGVAQSARVGDSDELAVEYLRHWVQNIESFPVINEKDELSPRKSASPLVYEKVNTMH